MGNCFGRASWKHHFSYTNREGKPGPIDNHAQRTPMGGGKKRGVENLANDTPPKKGFWTPPSYGTFSTPLRCQCSVFPVQKSTPELTRSSFGGVQKFSGEHVLWYVFFPPYLCWVRAASGPFLENDLFALKVGLRWVFVNELEWVQKWVKSGFLGAKVGQNRQNPLLHPLKTHFTKTHF